MTIIPTPAPATWTNGSLMPEDMLNTEIRDVLRFITSGCEATCGLSSDQSIPSSTSSVTVTWTSEIEDVDGIINVPSDTFTFTRDGIISLRVFGTFTGASGGHTRQIRAILHNPGTVEVGLTVDSSGSTDGDSMCLSTEFPVQSGNTLTINVQQDSGSALAYRSAFGKVHLAWVGVTAAALPAGSVYTAPPPAPSPPPTPKVPVKHVSTYYAQWSRTYDGDNTTTWDDTPECYQGYYSSARGNTKSLVGFNSAALVNELRGAQKISMVLSFYTAHTFWGSGMTCCLGAHNYANKPGTWSGANVAPRQQNFHVNHDAWANVNLNSTMVRNLANGTWKGVAFGPGPSTSNVYYGFIDGATKTNSRPRIQVTYYK